MGEGGAVALQPKNGIDLHSDGRLETCLQRRERGGELLLDRKKKNWELENESFFALAGERERGLEVEGEKWREGW